MQLKAKQIIKPTEQQEISSSNDDGVIKKGTSMNTLHSCLAYYLLAINAVAFIVYGIDKYKAMKAKWRIPEATLLLLAVLGGSIGAWMGMKVWHHKTMHKKFKYGIPAILLIQIALMAYLHMNR